MKLQLAHYINVHECDEVYTWVAIAILMLIHAQFYLHRTGCSCCSHHAGHSLGADIGNCTDHTMMWFIAAPFDLSAVVGMVLAYCGVYGLRGIGV